MARPRSDSPPLFELPPPKPDFTVESRSKRRGVWPVAGTDEAGRGPLAGPVVAAAVILDPRGFPEGLDDSKRLLPEAREAIFEQILRRAAAVSVASVCAGSIDASDIRKASLEAMRRAVDALAIAPQLVLADGRDVPPGLPCEGRALIKGDQRSQSIAAASIVAKVTRDRLMARCGAWHPAYGFERHAGYATEFHRAAIAAAGGIAGLHRMTFSPFGAIEAAVEAAE